MKNIDRMIIELLENNSVTVDEIASQLGVSSQTVRNRVKHLNSYEKVIEVERGLVTKIGEINLNQNINEDDYIDFMLLIDEVSIKKMAGHLFCSEKTMYAKVKKNRDNLKSRFSNILQVHYFIEITYDKMKSYVKYFNLEKCHQKVMGGGLYSYDNLTIPISKLIDQKDKPESLKLERECELFVKRFIRYIKYCFDSVDFKEQTMLELEAHLISSYLTIYYELNESQQVNINIISKYLIYYNAFCENIKYFLKVEGMKLNENQSIYIFIILLKDILSSVPKLVNIVVLCENGIATSYLVEEQLKQHFEKFKCMYIGSVSQYLKVKDSLTEEYLIINVGDELSFDNSICVSAIFDDKTLSKLSKHLSLRSDVQLSDYQLFTRLKKVLKNTIDYKAFKAILRDSYEKEEYMLVDLIKPQLIQTKTWVDNWQDAIKICAQPLLKEEYITKNYIEAMIENVYELGTYIILVDGFALPHSKPEDGANKVGISVLVLKEPVIFPDNKNVNVIMTLSTSKANEHLQALVDLSNLLKIDNVIDDLKNLTSSKQIYDYIKEF